MDSKILGDLSAVASRLMGHNCHTGSPPNARWFVLSKLLLPAIVTVAALACPIGAGAIGIAIQVLARQEMPIC